MVYLNNKHCISFVINNINDYTSNFIYKIKTLGYVDIKSVSYNVLFSIYYSLQYKL